ncbi:phosphonate degradation operons associated HDIG domain protein [Tistlia consotensis]|uniref:Gamma-butyrobetaine dioxygenase n=1 Tax=Tistlia consotensis USBA 355 TaxID=560819 RepID=A0A1Y6CY60_9PROT|nr:phosphonate degradation HD-domain oxygenase [Tistlia consotensis]SMF82589.1 gamma-butyrobetaine dioxygenase [Tistlia consotensis USBA 355]SNS29501.1 phosphonate degradation operons associated HDIG domain protein [Tistlia consotensis]
MSPVVSEIEAVFAAKGGETYGEQVTQLEHALQCAALAAADGAAPSLVAAALLHDVGHLIEEPDDAFGQHRHDRGGAAWLSSRFGPEVTEPVRLHVAAKRWLCAVEPGYFDRLSPASVHSLKHQGGPMSAPEARAFEAEPFHDQAVRLRRWDEEGKREGLHVRPLGDYRELLEGLVLR